jgi:hypothetical protein
MPDLFPPRSSQAVPVVRLHAEEQAMTLTVDLVLLIAAFICFALAAIGVSPPRVGLVPLGLALWVLTAII